MKAEDSASLSISDDDNDQKEGMLIGLPAPPNSFNAYSANSTARHGDGKSNEGSSDRQNGAKCQTDSSSKNKKHQVASKKKKKANRVCLAWEKHGYCQYMGRCWFLH